MKKSSTLFLKIVLALIAIAAFIWLLWFPQTEGRASNLDLFSVYSDPFIIYGFLASIPFFVGLYQAYKLLSLIDTNKAFSADAVNTLKNMKNASLIFIGFIVLAILFIQFAAPGDDPAGPTALGIVISFTAAVIATTLAIFEKHLQAAVDIQSENELTV